MKTHVIYTQKEKCRVCYTCVRECPVKAIRIVDGQAQIVPERCIVCGHCVRVCSQEAKTHQSDLEIVKRLLGYGPQVATAGVATPPVACLLAPSFAAEFDDTKSLIASVKHMGFTSVHEVGFGADMVAQEYSGVLSKNQGSYIGSTCPAIVQYIEKYETNLVPQLMPVVSPMIATSRAVKKIRGIETRIVFVGPCLAKKTEAQKFPNEIDAVLTFKEFRQLMGTFHNPNTSTNTSPIPHPESHSNSDFDPPLSNFGGLFALSRGLLHVAHLKEDLIDQKIVAADSRYSFKQAISEFKNSPQTHLLECLSCEGCVQGPGFSENKSIHERKRLVSRSVSLALSERDEHQWASQMELVSDLDLSRSYSSQKQPPLNSSEDQIQRILEKLGKSSPHDQLDCGACGYETCHEYAVAFLNGLAEEEMCLPFTIEQLKKNVHEIQSLQDSLIQREKLASMGQLSAGIAHELNNPLGIILMYSELLAEQINGGTIEAADLKMIVEQANRCKRIVSGLLNFSRQSKIVYTRIDVKSLFETIERNFSKDQIEFSSEIKMDPPFLNADEALLTQVLTNLVANSKDAISAKPLKIILRAEDLDGDYVLSVEDNGCGISEENQKKIFSPFFTTKPVGKGTGLGLSISYGIVKMHGGQMSVVSKTKPFHQDTGTRMILKIPKKDNLMNDMNPLPRSTHERK